MRTVMLAIFVCALVLMLSGNVAAQTREHAFEIGAVFTSITLTDFRERVLPASGGGDATVKGMGGRFAYNISRHLAVDAEANFLPESHFGNEEIGQKLQGFVGLRAGTRQGRFGVFGKVRPGVMWFGDLSSFAGCTNALSGVSCRAGHEKDFALDIGGVVEVYPSARTIVRFDVGDTLVRFKPGFGGSLMVPQPLPAATRHNFQWTIGFGYRF
jgi:Outer membrane protein beta-barrel domain